MSDTLAKPYGQVRLFHLTFGVPAPDYPTMQTEFLVTRRIAFIESELAELADARTIAEQADAYLDVLYFALGGLVEIGVEPSKIFDLVQDANMAKLWPDGLPRFREVDGKIMKPEGWTAPDALIAAEIEGQLKGQSYVR